MIKVVDYKPEHLERIKLKDCHQTEVPKTVLTKAVTFERNDEPIAIFGAFQFVEGVYHIWGMVSDEVYKAPLEFHKACLSALKFFEISLKPRRLQIDVREDCPENVRWATLIGFKLEGIMTNYGLDGSSYWLMARCKWER